MKWFISDIHFGHFNVIKYGERPFKKYQISECGTIISENSNTVYRNENKKAVEKKLKKLCLDDMHRTLIDNWNSQVKDNDEVWFLGDFAYLKDEDVKKITAQLKGKKIIIVGNHDKSPKKMIELGFDEAYKKKEIKIKDIDVLLSHYPYLEDEFLEVEKRHFGKLTKFKKGMINLESIDIFKHDIKLNEKCPVCGKIHDVKNSYFGCYKDLLYSRLKDYEFSKKFFRDYYGKELGVSEPKNSEYAMVLEILKKMRKRFIGDKYINRGQWLLHGHVHQAWKVKGNMINLSVEVWDYKPVSEDTIYEIISQES